MTKPISLPGIILAAGNSRRMGKNKLLLPFRNKAILQHVIDAAHLSSLSPLILVTGADNSSILKAIDIRSALVIKNPARDGGYGSSLQAGLAAVQESCKGVMFLPGDQPLLCSSTIEKLIAAFQKEPDRWIAPSWNSQRGNPVITPASWFYSIFALKGDTGPREHLKDPAAKLKIVAVEDRGVIFDIDSPEDYQLLLSHE